MNTAAQLRNTAVENRKKQIVCQSQCSTVGDPLFAVAGARLWNSLPPDIVTVSNRFVDLDSHILLFCVSFSLCSLLFLADRTNGRAYATVLRLSSVCLSAT